MNLKDNIKKDYLTARKEKNEVAKEVLGQIVTAIKNKEIELKPQNKEITDSDIIKIIEKEIKQLNEEKEYLEKANRIDDAKYITEKIVIIEQYLPKKLSKEELKEIIIKWKQENNIGNILSERGNLFKYLKDNFDGQYNGKEVNEIVNDL